MGWKTEWFEFSVAEKILTSTAKSARHGFQVPIPFVGNRTFGIKTGGWGALESGTFSPIANWDKLRALSQYENGGLLGFRRAEALVAKKFGTKIASNIGARYMLGRAAGIAFGVANAYWLSSTVAMGAIYGYKAFSSAVSKQKGLELGGNFFDTQASYTSRQRAMQAITAGRLQARSAIGNEGFLLHR